MAKTSHTRAHEGAADNSAKKQRGRPFQPGQSGNPAGMPKGTRHRATQLVEQLLADESQAIGRKLVERAMEGDAVALRLAVERLCPVRRGRAVEIDLPRIDGVADLARAMGAILTAVGTGTLTAEEGLAIANIVEMKRRAIETAELEQRIAVLEERGA